MKTVLPFASGHPVARGLLCVFSLLLACSFPAATSAQTRILRIVTYNIEDDINGATTPLPGLIAPSGGTVEQGGVLEGIGEEILGNDPAQPLDILALQETTSNATTVSPIVNGLNAFYSAPGMYAMSPYQATESGGDTADGNGPNALVYNTTTLQLLASIPVDPPGGTGKLGSSSGEYREAMRYEFAPAGLTPTPANEFYVYVSHYKSGTKSSDLTARNGEAQIIRNDAANNLPANARVIYAGDYNITTSSEASYQTILASTAPNGTPQGQGVDPGNPTGVTGINWGTSTTSPSILALETESATDLRYRDDLQLMTTNVYYGAAGGLALVPGTYHVFGNNGTTPYYGSLNSGSDTALNNDLAPGSPLGAPALYSDLTTASDHLPVVADYTIPVPAPPVVGFTASPTNGTAPLSVSFSNLSVGAATYSWAFGDGNTSALSSPSNVYTNPGVFSVTLTATGAGGVSTVTMTNSVVVLSPAPASSLQLVGCIQSGTNGFQFALTNNDGMPITADEESRIQIYATSDLTSGFANWTALTNQIWLTNGCLQITDPESLVYPQRFYRAVETP